MSGANRCKHGRQFQFVTQRWCNHSAFNGYRRTLSLYSTVVCAKCGNHWRSKSDYVDKLPDAPDGWFNMTREQLQQWLCNLQ
jgi:hypothetical protein